MHAVLRNALGQAVRWELLSRNPAAAIRPPRVEQKALQTYDLAQTAALIEAVRDSHIFVPVLLGVLCGMRRGEICALKWGSVDLDSGRLSVVESAEQTRAGVRLKSPKSGKSRTIALTATLVEELRRHRVKQAEELLQLGIRQTGDTFVCTLADGSQLRPNTLTIYWARLVGQLELPPIRFHDLRHAAATHMLALGVHPKVVSERLGHSKVGITLDLYSHVLPGMQEDAVSKLEAAFKATKWNSRQ